MVDLSLNAIDQLYQTISDDPILHLLKLTFPTSGSFYVVNNTEDITSNGQLYTAFPFLVTLPPENSEDVPQINITLSNVELTFIDEFRIDTSNITAEVRAVFASAPDFEEFTILDLEVRQISSTTQSIQVVLAYNDILNVEIPSCTYSPVDFPGLFNV